MTTQTVLPLRSVLGVNVNGRASVSALEGEIWVTGPGLGDEVLGRGESVVVRGPGRIVVQALTQAQVRIQRAE